ncbi:MAG: zinc-ribbon domain-containing protein [Deltaproteobacteria bacterium]|nr:zinc-ribbon domain-containing protein [Deltaproteobacteria bacterium]
MKCPKCQTENPDTQSFCGDCGTNLGPAKEALSFTMILETPVEEHSRGG